MLPENGVKPSSPAGWGHYNTALGRAEPKTGAQGRCGRPAGRGSAKRLKTHRSPAPGSAEGRLKRCPVTLVTLDSGEILKKGCGRRGLTPFEAGWKCFYCGNYQYAPASGLDDLWFHFRTGREYWRVQSSAGREYVNGVPVAGAGDALPAGWMRDLADPRPPEWFRVYVQCDERQFNQYLQDRESR